MRYTFAAILALATSVLAQDATAGFAVISKPTRDENVPAGQTYEITWAPNPKFPGDVKIEIIAGPTNTSLQLVTPPIATGVDGSKGTYDWAVAPTFGDQAVYGLKISLESDSTVFQYSLPFHITGSSPDGPKSNSTMSRGPSSWSTSAAPSSTSASDNTQETGKTTPTTPSSAGSASSTGNAAPTSTVVDAGAPTIGSTLALFGGLAMAVLAL